eukprot:2495152-Amphidinium_carterae.1
MKALACSFCLQQDQQQHKRDSLRTLAREVLVAVGNAESAACVSELLAVGRSGLPSRGSRGRKNSMLV